MPEQICGAKALRCISRENPWAPTIPNMRLGCDVTRWSRWTMADKHDTVGGEGGGGGLRTESFLQCFSPLLRLKGKLGGLILVAL